MQHQPWPSPSAWTKTRSLHMQKLLSFDPSFPLFLFFSRVMSPAHQIVDDVLMMMMFCVEFAQKRVVSPSPPRLGSWKPQFNLLDGDSVDTMATGFRNLPVPIAMTPRPKATKTVAIFMSSHTGTIVYVGCAMCTDICLEMHLTAFEKSRLAERRAGHAVAGSWRTRGLRS